jgi:hypothetical protein
MDTRPFIKACVVAILVVAAADTGLRVFQARLSGDVANTRRFPELIADLAAAEGERVVAVGNSLMGDGLAVDAFLESWLDPNPGVGRLAKLVPDGSSIWDWYCITRFQLARPGSAPDLVLVGFGWDQLSDQAPINLARTFNEICPASALGSIHYFSGQGSIGSWMKMATVKSSKLYAQREAIRHRVLQSFVPSYQKMTRQANARAGAADIAPASPVESSYEALRAVLSSMAAQGTEVVLVAMPVQEPYEIDHGLCGEGGEHEFRLVDMRYSVPSSNALYRDNLHLNADGADLFSERLARELRASGAQTRVCRL